jgi:cholesterol oxidase
VTGRYTLRFTEEMKGWFAFGETDCRRGAAAGRETGAAVMFHLTIVTDDVRRFIEERDHTAQARGWVKSDVLGGRLPVMEGVFNLFVTEGPHSRRMLYRLFFADSMGHPLTLSGFKEINGGSALAVWPETSTLYTRILQGHVGPDQEADATIVGSGVLRILPPDFARQLTTFRTFGPSLRGRVSAMRDFIRLFGGQLWIVFDRRSAQR